MMVDFSEDSVKSMSELVKGKIIQSVVNDRGSMDDFLIFNFLDGSSLIIRYDWICEWEIIKMNLCRAEHWETTCDDCLYQEDRHYCLLHGIQVKNMDLMRCDNFEQKEDERE